MNNVPGKPEFHVEVAFRVTGFRHDHVTDRSDITGEVTRAAAVVGLASRRSFLGTNNFFCTSLVS